MKPLYSVWPDNWKEPNPGSISVLRYRPSRSLAKKRETREKENRYRSVSSDSSGNHGRGPVLVLDGTTLYKPGMVRSAEGSSYTLIPPAPSEEASRMYADLFPNAEFQIIKNTSHFPFSENPETFSKIVGNFLQDLN